jgi:hypothetical protein
MTSRFNSRIRISLDFCLAHAYLFIGLRESPKVDFSSAMEKKKEKEMEKEKIFLSIKL